MDVAVVIGLVFVLAVLALVTVATVRGVRAVKTGVERTGAQVRRTVEETTLKARSAQPGPVGEAARIRLELRNSIDGTRAALEAGARDDPGLSDAVHLLDRLHEHARQLDGELRLLMEHEPDRTRVTGRLQDARERMHRIKESADSLRFAAQDRARQFDAEGLDALRGQIDIESGALRHWTPSPARESDPTASAPADAEAQRSTSGRKRETPPATNRRGTGEAAGGTESRPELGPSGQGLDPSWTDPAADRGRTPHTFGKRPPRSAS
ncbi:hypothetical protein MMF93_10980 [Streptomyces tubbatahanensis]|uniref:Secreted protein n=1 Tax=Streptomyces tubbatahanensis TaxID=2923272 RepID=A0ABY3XR83_9ACTN|nr:hypothetical protein [Streptomyces tubbatahanensis]UNS96973.1 hypothetical protein MMF93_10980 [Streptomyces tubbatahanensis]